MSTDDKAEATGESQEAQSRRRKRSILKGKFHRIYNRFNDLRHTSDLDLQKNILTDLEAAYKELERGHSDYVELLNPDNEDDGAKLQQTENDMESIYGELCECRSFIHKVSEAVKSKQKADAEKTRERETVKVKKLDAPKFGGSIREFPSFKRDYETIMGPTYGGDPFALKSCLHGEALRTIQGVDNDYYEMWKRLILKYGRPERLTDTILCDLRKLKSIPDGDHACFIASVETIERCYLDLKRVDMEGEMNTNTMVSEIEKILPSVQKREWILRKKKCDKKTNSEIFLPLLDFLLEEKDAMEYIQSEVRSDQKARIHHVAESTHSTASDELCSQLKQNQEVLQKVVKELSHISEIVSKGNQAPRRFGRVSPTKRCWYHDSNSHDIIQCYAFNGLDVNTRIDLLKKNRGCFSCLRSGHLSRNCPDKHSCDHCGEPHHTSLHLDDGHGNVHNIMHIVNGEQSGKGVLLMISEVPCKDDKLSTLWDPGSDISLITHRATDRLRLLGQDVTLSVSKVGNVVERLHTKEYIVPLTDKNGHVWQIKAYGMEQITANVCQVDLNGVSRLFKGISDSDICRPRGEIELLIGSDCSVLLPMKIDSVGNLQLMKNQFGFCLRGSHSMLKISAVSHYACVNHLRGSELNSMRIVDTKTVKEDFDNFLNIESLGTYCQPKCGGCRCGHCSPGNANCTLKEERELRMIEDGLEYSKTEKKWTVSYPWTRDPSDLPNNVNSATGRLRSTEQRLRKNGRQYALEYQKQMDDMVERKVARKLTHSEISAYKGPVHYIPHHEVMKPESKSTPLRIVFNSSASYMGHTINDYWAKGPNVLNDILSVLLKFRENQIALVGDISKMYNSIHLCPRDQHTHRFLWRDLESERPPDHYALTCVPFGDRPSGAIAITALKKTAEMSEEMYPQAVEVIKNNSYVDDILASAPTQEAATKLAKDIDHVLDVGGFAIKHWIVSGDQRKSTPGIKLLSTETEKILGLTWKPVEDVFTFSVQLTFLRRGEKSDEGVKVSSGNIADILTILTRRMVLSQVAGVYDPLGLAVPYILAAKILMRKLCQENSNSPQEWDKPLSAEDRQCWIEFFSGLFDLERLKIPRCIQPPTVSDGPILVIFSDGSNLAFGACAYVRWEVAWDTYKVMLIMAKNRIAPTKQLSIPRLELCGAVLSARIRETVVNSMNFSFTQIFHLVDSAIVRAQIQKESYGFGTFVANRIAEIQSKTDKSEWFLVPSDVNPADLTTRVTSTGMITEESTWQRGPEFLYMPIEQWPIKHTIDVQDIPDVVVHHASVVERKPLNYRLLVPQLIDTNRISSLRKLYRLTSILQIIIEGRSFKGVTKNISAERLRNAEISWIAHAQSDLPDNAMHRFRRLGPQVSPEGIVMVGHRMNSWLENSWNQTSYSLLPANHDFTEFVVRAVHEEDHAGVDVTLAKLRSRFWIPKVKGIINRVKSRCVTCKKKYKVKETQQMGQMADARIRPAPAFYMCAVDLFGPLVIRDTVKKRTHGKGYGVLFNCLVSRAVYIDLAEGYDVGSFLMVLRRFVSIRGYPRKMISDAGTQLVAAGKELRDVVHSWDWDGIHEFGKTSGMDWETTKSADAPWENGCSEALIRSTKLCLETAIGSSVMTYSELQTVLFEVSNLLNERPIGTKNCDPTEGTYLCPNDLLLGRASVRVPVGDWGTCQNPRIRWKFVQLVVDTFWRRWTRDYFHTLLIRQKWHTEQRNVQSGDIVLVQDSNNIRGQWKLAQVCEAIPGRDGKVRDVKIRYKNVDEGHKYRGCQDTIVNRSVRRLVVLLPKEEQA